MGHWPRTAFEQRGREDFDWLGLARHGVKMPEPIRDIVRRYLAQEGRLPG